MDSSWQVVAATIPICQDPDQLDLLSSPQTGVPNSKVFLAIFFFSPWLTVGTYI